MSYVYMYFQKPKLEPSHGGYSIIYVQADAVQVYRDAVCLRDDEKAAQIAIEGDAFRLAGAHSRASRSAVRASIRNTLRGDISLTV